MNTAQLVRQLISAQTQTKSELKEVDKKKVCIMSKVIFISGKVTGDNGYRDKFKLAEIRLKAQGYIVMNPSVLPDGISTNHAMQICLTMLSCCDCVYMLKDWKESRGATIEHEFASYAGKEIIYEEDTNGRNRICN